MVDSVIQSVTKKLSSLPYTEGTVLRGPRTRGTHTGDPDIDFGTYCNSELFDITVVNQFAVELDSENRSNLTVPSGAWGDWISGDGWLVINGYHADSVLRDTKRVVQVTRDTEQGITTANYRTGHPHGYTSAVYRGESATSKMLYANDENFYELKKQTECYPAALQKGLIESFMSEAGFSLMLAENNIDKDDVSYARYLLYTSLSP